MNWNQQPEEQKARSPEEVRQAFALLFGEEYIPPANADHQTATDQPTEPKINFPELDNRCPELSLQQIKPVENRRETSSSPSEPRSPYEPKRGPRGALNGLPEATQKKILDLRETLSRAAAAEVLSKPAPEGLGIQVTERMLERFENRYRVIEQRADIDAIAAAAREVTSDPETTDADLTNATLRIIRAAVLEYATDIQNFEALERLNDVLHKLRRADQADRRQTYLEQKESNDSSGLKDRPHESPGRSPGARLEAASRSERAQHSIDDNSQPHAYANDKPSANGN